jgi:hypothetical protein
VMNCGPVAGSEARVPVLVITAVVTVDEQALNESKLAV